MPRRDEGIDAVGIGSERRLHFGRKHGELRFGGAVKPERAQGAVDAERARAQHFGQPPGAIAPHHVHREQPLLRVEEAQREIGVVLACGADRRNAVRVAAYSHRCFEPAERERAVRLRQRRPEPQRRCAEADRKEENQREENSRQETPHHAPSPQPSPQRGEGV